MKSAILRERLLDPNFWKALNPELSLESNAKAKAEAVRWNWDQIHEHVPSFQHEGYFHLRSVLKATEFPRMVKGIHRIVDLGLPAVFGFVYLEYWHVFELLMPLPQTFIGDFHTLPDLWIWFVDTSKGHSGWSPHRDKGLESLRADGTAKSLSLWVPLTEATPLNSCMYVVPIHLDPSLRDPEARFRLQDIRALPASPGDVMGWNQAVYHWGSSGSERCTAPRISMSFEFQCTDVPPFNQPFVDLRNPGDFRCRMRLVAKQIMQYQKNYAGGLSDEFTELLESLAFGE